MPKGNTTKPTNTPIPKCRLIWRAVYTITSPNEYTSASSYLIAATNLYIRYIITRIYLMAAFKFNFYKDPRKEENQEFLTNENKDEIQWLESEEIKPDSQIVELDNIAFRAKMFTYNDIEIGHVLPSEAVLRIKDSSLKNAVELAENKHSDLVVGKYEGGLKVWECTEDLIQYLEDNEINFESKRVLDLGCGAGILGIYAFMKGANVTFQDYNKEVLECVTIPNVLLNIEEEDRESIIKKFKFYSGDWSSFSNKLSQSNKYDVILTSETIYNVNNYDKLISLFLERLNDNGIVYVAAKTYYFGVGGGTRRFEESLQKYKLNHEVVWKSSGGIQREILKLTR